MVALLAHIHDPAKQIYIVITRQGVCGQQIEEHLTWIYKRKKKSRAGTNPDSFTKEAADLALHTK